MFMFYTFAVINWRRKNLDYNDELVSQESPDKIILKLDKVTYLLIFLPN